MRDESQNTSIDTDIMIGNMLNQAEAVVAVDAETLARGKRQLLAWMEKTEAYPASTAPTRTGGSPAAAEPPSRLPMQSTLPGSERLLSEMKLLTVAEVAAVMRLSKMTVYRLVHSGHLPAVRVGRSFRVPAQAVQEYLQENDSSFTESLDRP